VLLGGEEYVGEYILLGVLELLKKSLAYLGIYPTGLPGLADLPFLLLPPPHREWPGCGRRREPDPLFRHPPRLGPHHQMTGWHAPDLVQSISDVLSHQYSSQGMPLSLGG
jgi:hypothetical protein